ncbi:hypothetical protein GPALN_010947 [Globodera pallida]|nr:hypothetical protein GPALN_010947 [Globodera pallida]
MFQGQRAEVRANVPPEHNECMFEICLCNNFKNGFGCILTNDCDSDDEDFGPNGYLFYVKIAVESEKKTKQQNGQFIKKKDMRDKYEETSINDKFANGKKLDSMVENSSQSTAHSTTAVSRWGETQDYGLRKKSARDPAGVFSVVLAVFDLCQPVPASAAHFARTNNGHLLFWTDGHRRRLRR